MAEVFDLRLNRALTQRIYVVRREENTSGIHFLMMGNSGTKYSLSIKNDLSMSCACPDHTLNDNFCKHLIFLCIKVLGLTVDRTFHISQGKLEQETFQQLRKETVITTTPTALNKTDSCSICIEEFGEQSVECCQTCSNFFHAMCLFKWFENTEKPTCVLCRAEWFR